LVAAPAFAGPGVVPIDGAGYLRYNVATGEITLGNLETRRGGCPNAIWSAGFEYVGFVFNRNPDAGHGASDWGDVAATRINGLEFSSFTNSMDTDGDVWVVILYYAEDDGFGSTGKVFTAGVVIQNIPGNNHSPSQYWGYRWRVDLVTPFVLDGSDLDGDGLGDFGYFMFCSGRTPGCVHGAGIWDRALIDPNNLPPEASGVEDAVDTYTDATWNTGWNNIDPNNINAAYVGTYTFADAWGQMHHVLFWGCPNRGESGRYCTADIDGSHDCLVSLSDLALCLAEYGTCGDDLACDLFPCNPDDPCDCGDGCVRLDDLAEALAQYGDNCNWPQ
jgi:hypothetical protein